MSGLIGEETWVWIVVQDPGGREQYLGQQDDIEKTGYIPAFLDKGSAEKGLNLLVRNKNLKYEVQAIRYPELEKDASRHGFMIFLLDEDGKILEKINPP